jgi:hypothetical protein
VIYEGALSFATKIRSSNRKSPYKVRMGRQNDKRPSSKPGLGQRGERRGERREPPGDRHALREREKGVRLSLVNPLFRTKLDWH